jgi:hypothetical protein
MVPQAAKRCARVGERTPQHQRAKGRNLSGPVPPSIRLSRRHNGSCLQGPARSALAGSTLFSEPSSERPSAPRVVGQCREPKELPSSGRHEARQPRIVERVDAKRRIGTANFGMASFDTANWYVVNRTMGCSSGEAPYFRNWKFGKLLSVGRGNSQFVKLRLVGTGAGMLSSLSWVLIGGIGSCS